MNVMTLDCKNCKLQRVMTLDCKNLSTAIAKSGKTCPPHDADLLWSATIRVKV